MTNASTTSCRTTRLTLLATTALSLAAPMTMLMSTAAFAADAAASASTAANGLQIQEVIVTSRKREESAQKVPIAMTAITGQLKTADVQDIRDIVAYTPNVRIDGYAQRANAANITIRGISPSRLDDNSIDSPIGVLIDGIYLGSLPGQIIDNFDLQRIEILRGPQGTLFGRNTIGGALNVIRTEPTGEWGAKLQYTTGSWNDQQFRAVFNAPLIKDVLALKLFWNSQNRDGFIHNTYLNINEPYKNYKNFGGALKFTPNDWFKAVLTVEKYEDRSEGGAFLTNYSTAPGVLPPAKTPNDINAPGSAVGPGGGFITTFLPGLFGLQNVPARTDLSLPKTIDDNFSSPGDVETAAYTLNMSAVINPNLKLVSVTGYRQQHELASEDFDGSSANLITVSTDAHYHQFSQEFRLEGNWDTKVGKINTVLGAYYFNSYFNRHWVTGGEFWTLVPELSGYNVANNTWASPALAASTGFADPISACLAPRTTPALQKVFGRVQCDPGVPGGGAGYGPNLVNKLYESQNTDSLAFFAHGDWEFYPRFTLTAGVRYTYEKKHFIGYQSYLLPVSRINVDDFPSKADLSKSYSQVTPTAALSWQATNDILFYGSFSEGWHSGGFFGVNQNTADFLSNQYAPETSQSYEIGMKSQFFDHRVQLNLAGFLNDFSNKQESAIAFDKTTNTVVTLFTNVGGLEYKGVEGELEWIITRRLSVAGSFGYLNAKYTNLLIGYPGNQAGAVPLVNATFLIPRNAPDLTLGGSATYVMPVGPGELTLNGRANWVDTEQGDLYNESHQVIPSHADIAASVSYAWKAYKFTVFGKNLTNWRHEQPVFIAPLFAAGTINPGASWGAELLATF